LPHTRSNAELDAAIVARAMALSLGAALLAEGQTIVALDEQGRLVEYRPDGTSTVLDAEVCDSDGPKP
jgi:hypothetical protein